MGWKSWVGFGVVAGHVVLTTVALVRQDVELAMIAGMSVPVALGALAFAIVEWRGMRRRRRESMAVERSAD